MQMVAILFSFLFALNADEISLVNKINDFRVKNGLPQLQINDSLNKVAAAHTKDISEHYQENGTTNLHSWSINDKWVGGKFDINDPSTYHIVWDKPREISKMDADGFELAHRHFETSCNSECAFNSFVQSVPHKAKILEKNGYEKFTKIGISIYKNIVCVWLA